MKHRACKLLIAAALLFVLPVSLLLYALSLPSFYGGSYYAELSDMYERLYETEGKKLVIIGGSNVAFGVDTQLLESILTQHGFEYTVCPFGLYAAVGTSVMLELSEDALSDGDIVILAFEPTTETMSSYFGATAFWKCCEDSEDMLLHLNRSQTSAMAGNYIPYLQERYAILKSGDFPQPEGVYTKASFNEACNMTYDREGNAMALGFDTGAPVDLAAVTIEEAFAQQVNQFYLDARQKGAAVYFSFSPVNHSALVEDSAVQSYFELCSETFLCPIISDPNRYIMDAGWFYDNNFHLNSAGAIVRTRNLAEDILAQLGCYDAVSITMPDMPASIAEVKTEDVDNRFFTYQSFEGGYLVSGLTDDGLEQTSLTVPSSYQGMPVVGFTADALSAAGCLQELTLPSSVESLPDGVFRNCAALERLILEHTDSLCRVTEHTFDGAEKLRIFVPSDAYHLYRDGTGCEINNWSTYLNRIYQYG